MSPLVSIISERREAEVMQDTWGHLRATPGVKHHGTIVFAEGVYGCEQTILHCDFGEDAGDGPWFYENIQAWLAGQDTEPGRLYTFTGWYRETDESGEFSGEITSKALIA